MNARFRRLTLAVLAAATLGGCATSGNSRDPIEGFNRAMFAFNEGLDQVAIRPVAQGYEAAVPTPVRTGIANFFGNIADVFIGINNVLQGKMPEGINDFGRVAVNTTLGVFGFMDVATDLGVEKHDEDFGQTLGRWGMGSGAYVVLPLWGPRTVRDTGGLILDLAADPVANIRDVPARNTLIVTRLISDRAMMLPADKVIDEAALDKYSYIRDGYLQRRRTLINDGIVSHDYDDE
ncbi:MAG: VacJ family lipoprotein [Proteobacteria bacterium]|nr:VacJ family lipoprotein [Pseudomonadota bacterium]HQR03730.1 VacJ family lipoprotein [Rhodocyclaceae bacterium]